MNSLGYLIFFLFTLLTRISPVFVFFSFSLCFSSLPCISGVMLDSDWGWGTTHPVTPSFHSIGRPIHCRSPPTNGCFPMAAPLLYSADKFYFKLINYLFPPKCVFVFNVFKTCCCCYFWCVCVFSPIFFSLPSPDVPPLPVLCLFPIFFSQSLQWRDWKRVWWRTLATPLMKRKTTQLPKPQGQVTLGQFPLPPHPQAGHRAIAALHHPRLVLKHSHSHNLYHSGWHPKTGKHTQYSPPDSYRTFTQTEPVLFHHSNS